MKIIKGRVDWLEGRGNRPRLYVLVDRVPSLDDMRFRERKGLYFAERDGLCSFFSWRGNGNHNGFGGREFPITMVDGEKRTLKGPWSSSASTMNEYGFGPCMEVHYTDDPKVYVRGHTFFGGAILVSLLRDYASVIDVGTGYSWRPGTTYAAEVAFPEGSRFSLACTGLVTDYGRDGRRSNFWSLPERLPDGARVENVRAALHAAIDANEHAFARGIADRYVRYLHRDAFDTLMSLSDYEPAVKLPDGTFWTKPA